MRYLLGHKTTHQHEHLTARALESDCVCGAGYGWFDDVQDAAGAPLCRECPVDTY